MQRITISLDTGLAEAFDAYAAERSYHSRSEAVRDLVRAAVDARDIVADPDAPCVAALSYVYDHGTRDLATRLTAIGHAHHDLIISTTHVHLDHNECLETTMLRGPASRVRALADAIRAERGVRFGALNLVGVELGDAHEPGTRHDGHHHHSKVHATPRRS